MNSSPQCHPPQTSFFFFPIQTTFISFFFFFSFAYTHSHTTHSQPTFFFTFTHSLRRQGPYTYSAQTHTYKQQTAPKQDSKTMASETEHNWKFAQCFGDKGEVEDITEGELVLLRNSRLFTALSLFHYCLHYKERKRRKGPKVPYIHTTNKHHHYSAPPAQKVNGNYSLTKRVKQ